MVLLTNKKKTYLDLLKDKTGVYISIDYDNIKDIYSYKVHNGKFKIIALGGVEIARFSLIPMPECCGIVISTGSYVSPQFRNKGIGTLLNLMRIQIAHQWGYPLLICTDIQSNENQEKILKKNNWNKLLTFLNTRTNHELNISCIEVKETEYKLGFDLPYGTN